MTCPRSEALSYWHNAVVPAADATVDVVEEMREETQHIEDEGDCAEVLRGYLVGVTIELAKSRTRTRMRRIHATLGRAIPCRRSIEYLNLNCRGPTEKTYIV